MALSCRWVCVLPKGEKRREGATLVPVHVPVDYHEVDLGEYAPCEGTNKTFSNVFDSIEQIITRSKIITSFERHKNMQSLFGNPFLAVMGIL